MGNIAEKIPEYAEFLGVEVEDLEREMYQRYAMWGTHYSIWPNNIKKVETKNYKALVAHMEEHRWNEIEGRGSWHNPGDVEWVYKTGLFFVNRENPGKFYYKTIKEIKVRDMYDPHKDIDELKPYMDIEVLDVDTEKNTIKVGWVKDNDKKPHPRTVTEINLDEIYKEATNKETE